ncbi:leucine-rich repeat domain-containing protein [Intestinibacter bartlettii]|uniref:Leucine-rich repeat domain-containing protein n=1 Tax=Intestinibacter bartlettii TaxID=261299 RepID=A0ABS6DT60_9FIRM|nr:leucine-rich repeat domain-containing protein [Intestinibacter bartlettii]MBU5335010.1 leucine-rich repeat domain-containing protein [Intestinibacter bartlettii]
MRKVLKKSTIVLLALTFILSMVNFNGVNTSFADNNDTTQTTTEESSTDTSSDTSNTTDTTTDESSETDSSTEEDENTLTSEDGFKYILEDDEVTIKGYEGSETDITIPSEIDGHKVTKIGEAAFDGNEDITSVEIPDSITTIESYAFYNSTSLESVSIPESVTTIGEGAFANCTSLTTVNLPSKLTTISYGLFASCSSLTEIEIPKNVTSIEGYAFYTCTSLKDINIPEGVTSIGEAAFYYCTGLESIELSKNIEEIGDYAFDSCTNLTITGYSNTAAKTYASENSIPFKTIRTAWDYAKMVFGVLIIAGIIFLVYKLRAVIKNKRYLKNNINFDENLILVDNKDCKISITGKSNKTLLNGKEVKAKKKWAISNFVGYNYEIENKSQYPIQVYTKYITIGDYTDKFNLNEEIPSGKKAKGFAYSKKANSLDELKEVNGIIAICINKDGNKEINQYNFKID